MVYAGIPAAFKHLSQARQLKLDEDLAYDFLRKASMGEVKHFKDFLLILLISSKPATRKVY